MSSVLVVSLSLCPSRLHDPFEGDRDPLRILEKFRVKEKTTFDRFYGWRILITFLTYPTGCTFVNLLIFWNKHITKAKIVLLHSRDEDSVHCSHPSTSTRGDGRASS